METEKKELHCSFCGKAQNQVEKLIAGPNVFICNECVGLCNPILEDPNKSDGSALTICKLCGKSGKIEEMLILKDRGYMCQECIPIVQAEIVNWNAKND